MAALDLVGQRFGRLLVTAFDGRRGSAARHYYWRCACDCGETAVVDGGHLRCGYTQSCGCFHAERRIESHTKHGQCRSDELRTAEHVAWGSMISRCEDSARKDYRRYGGRGIAVCDRWKTGENGKSGFACFFDDMGKKPTPKHSLDRFPNNDGNYGPSNCRWATPSEQARNKRTSIIVAYKGEHIPLASACEAARLPYMTVFQRIKKLGWPLEKAITTPVRECMR